MRCPGCGTDTVVAPGIGPYCPNMKCDRIDGLQTMMGGVGLALGLWRQACFTVGEVDPGPPVPRDAVELADSVAPGYMYPISTEYYRLIDKAWADFTTQQVLDVVYGR